MAAEVFRYTEFRVDEARTTVDFNYEIEHGEATHGFFIGDECPPDG